MEDIQFEDNRLEYGGELEEEEEELPHEGEEMPEHDENNGGGGSFSNVAQGLSGHHRDIMVKYWQDTINSIEHDDHKFKIHQLPLARIKKVMKADEDVRMISAEAPILFAKGCDIFITELTMRAWIHAEENKRRTLQRSDIANALQKSDMFDFLIDIVPREEAQTSRRHTSVSAADYSNVEQHQPPQMPDEMAPPPPPPPHDEHQPHHPPQTNNDFANVYQYGDLNDYNGFRQY
jgi:nuclear transcription factor Y gamma